jgi:hypothetical protein
MMSHILYPYTVAALMVAALAAISIWSNHRLLLKFSAILIVALILPAAYLTILDLLSRPKPVSLEWSSRDLSEATVVGAHLKEGDRIFLWLRVEGLDEPRYYVMPWDEEVAKQLYGAQQEADAEGTEVRMNRPFARRNLETEMKFYALPQRAAPPKQGPSNSPYYYRSELRSEDRGV